MSCTPLPKAAKPVWAKQLIRLPCLVVYVKFQFVYTMNSLSLKATMSKDLLTDGPWHGMDCHGTWFVLFQHTYALDI